MLAHSAKNGNPAQTYEAHIQGVVERAIHYAEEAECYASDKSRVLSSTIQKSALLHDLGKLDVKNQSTLRDSDSKQRHLPVNHVDAGSAALKKENCLYAALMVYAHHRGLPDMAAELQREEAIFRDEHPAVRSHTDVTLESLLHEHHKLFPPKATKTDSLYSGNQQMFFRIALSCLADADHTDTAAAYGQMPEEVPLPQLRAKERLVALDHYVNHLGNDSERSRLRYKMYRACRNIEIEGRFSTCDSPVGSGKTTAVMAHLLHQAIVRNARRIFVVLPYTNIIQQSVNVYREALVLPGENPEEVVAELHSRADFQDYETRYLTSLWRAPIVVTTAVAFYETLASNRPSALRRLHELPGSMIFIDEAHNALPLKLLPLAWQWMNTLADEWGCYWVLASGSLVRYWKLDRLSEIEIPRPTVEELVNPELRKKLITYERSRVTFLRKETPLSRYDLIELLQKAPGPRLLILNTVQNAAVLASDLNEQFGRSRVEHLSTALTPEDRSKIITRIKQRLDDPTDTDWTLVATSCVEAGVDFSFRTGFREISSLLSLLQAAGRVNRHGNAVEAEMWSFSFRDDSRLTQNNGVKYSAAVLNRYFEKNTPITPELSTRSMNDEIILDDSCIKAIRKLMEQEESMQFQSIEQKFHVIDSDTVPAVIDTSLVDAILRGGGDWHTLQKKSVSIRRYNIKKWHLKEIASGIYQWTLKYDDFLGYMRGVLDIGSALFS